MALEKGRQQYLAIKPEATRFTAETTGFTKFLPWTDKVFNNETAYENDESAIGNRGKLLDKTLSSQYGTFSFGSKVDADNILLPLYHTFGAATPTTADGATTWAFSFLQNIQLPTFTAQYERGDEGAKRMVGCTVNTLNLVFGLDDSKYTVDGSAIKEEAGNAQTVAYSKPERKLVGRHAKLYYADDLATVTSGGTEIKIKSIETTIENGVDALRAHELGDVNPSEITADGITVQITFDSLIKTANAPADFQTWADTGVKKAFRLTVEADNLPVIGSSLLKPLLELYIPPSAIKVTNATPLDDLVMKTIEIEVEQPELITAKLINEVAAL